MRTSPGEFEAYLAPGESVVSGTTGTLRDGSFRAAGVVAVTDRRLLFVAEGDGFLDVAHDAVSSIRSHPRRGFSYQGMVPALLAVIGTGVAVAAFVGVLVLEPGVLGFVLTLVAVGGVVTAERVRRGGAPTVRRAAASAKTALLDALAGVERLRRHLERARSGGEPDLLVLAIVTVSLSALVGLIAATGSLLVVPLVLVTVGGLALAELGYRTERERDAGREDRPSGLEVSVHLVDGRVVRLQVDPDERFDHAVSAAVRESAPRTTTAGLTRL